MLFKFNVLFDSLGRASVHNYKFVIKSKIVTRLCHTQTITTVNGQFRSPNLYVSKRDTLWVKVYNRGKYNATIHWHGVRQIRTAWADGPWYITQCPIQPGEQFTYRFTIVEQEWTLWWHAHVSWLRATVHGLLLIYPNQGHLYPFPRPHAEIPIVLGEWWNVDPIMVEYETILTGGAPNVSDAFTINGQHGDLYPCSKSEITKFSVEPSKTYLLRMVNAAVNSELFFKIASHNITVVAVDSSYTKPYTTDVMFIAPSQTADVLLTKNQKPGKYYMAARIYTSQSQGNFDNTTTTAILEYVGSHQSAKPNLPPYNDTPMVTKFSRALRSLNSPDHPVGIPKSIDDSSMTTVGLGLAPCPTGSTCARPNNTRVTASMNNISFVQPDISILQAYYFGTNGVFTTDFPSYPPVVLDYTGDVPKYLWAPIAGTKLRVFDYNAMVQVVFQGANIFVADNHPMHIHGYDFYAVGEGFGNFDNETDSLTFNLVDPPKRNTVGVPVKGWASIRFRNDNPGVWFVHCHFNDHGTWGLETVFIVKNGPGLWASLEPPPPDLPKC